MEMTVGSAYKILGEQIKQGHSRKKLCVNKPSFIHPLEQDGCVILPVEKVEVVSIEIVDGDGCTKFRKSGEACSSTVCVLYGAGE